MRKLVLSVMILTVLVVSTGCQQAAGLTEDEVTSIVQEKVTSAVQGEITSTVQGEVTRQLAGKQVKDIIEAGSDYAAG